MGRKSTNRIRKGPTQKTRSWAITLWPLLQDIPLKTLKMDELALLLGVSKSTVYEYFGTKEEILSYVVEVKIEELQKLKDDLISKFLAAPHDLRHLQAYLLALPKGIAAHFLQELKQYFPGVWGKVWKFLENLLDDLRTYYKLGISSGSFQPISPELLIMIDRFFLTQLFSPPEFFGEDYSLEKMVEEYVKLRFEGLEVRRHGRT